MKLKGKVALITGSSRGIGRATALAMAKEGADIIVDYYKNKDKAQEVVAEIKKLGRRAIAVQADVSKADEVKSMVEKAIQTFGKIDILINNAGIFIITPLSEISEDDWNRTMNVNLKSQVLCAKAVLPHMKKGGAIINISSTSGGVESGVAGCAAYNASKAGVLSITKVLAVELAPNIRVNAIAPGIIKTDMTKQDTEENKRIYLARTPLKRFGEPEEIAKAAVFLASEDASFITGQLLVVDGGMSTNRFYSV